MASQIILHPYVSDSIKVAATTGGLGGSLIPLRDTSRAVVADSTAFLSPFLLLNHPHQSAVTRCVWSLSYRFDMVNPSQVQDHADNEWII